MIGTPPSRAVICACLLVLAGCASPLAPDDRPGTTPAATESATATTPNKSTTVTAPNGSVTAGQGFTSPAAATFVVDGDRRATVTLEVADSHTERRRGLMHRRSLARDHGMVFVYEGAAARSFWMKNTHVPLDIVFLDARGRVLNVAHAAPQPNASNSELRSYRSAGPAKYVVEVRRGFANRTEVGSGARVRFSNATFETPGSERRGRTAFSPSGRSR